MSQYLESTADPLMTRLAYGGDESVDGVPASRSAHLLSRSRPPSIKPLPSNSQIVKAENRNRILWSYLNDAHLRRSSNTVTSPLKQDGQIEVPHLENLHRIDPSTTTAGERKSLPLEISLDVHGRDGSDSTQQPEELKIFERATFSNPQDSEVEVRERTYENNTNRPSQLARDVHRSSRKREIFWSPHNYFIRKCMQIPKEQRVILDQSRFLYPGSIIEPGESSVLFSPTLNQSAAGDNVDYQDSEVSWSASEYGSGEVASSTRHDRIIRDDTSSKGGDIASPAQQMVIPAIDRPASSPAQVISQASCPEFSSSPVPIKTMMSFPSTQVSVRKSQGSLVDATWCAMPSSFNSSPLDDELDIIIPGALDPSENLVGEAKLPGPIVPSLPLEPPECESTSSLLIERTPYGNPRVKNRSEAFIDPQTPNDAWTPHETSDHVSSSSSSGVVVPGTFNDIVSSNDKAVHSGPNATIMDQHSEQDTTVDRHTPNAYSSPPLRDCYSRFLHTVREVSVHMNISSEEVHHKHILDDIDATQNPVGTFGTQDNGSGNVEGRVSNANEESGIADDSFACGSPRLDPVGTDDPAVLPSTSYQTTEPEQLFLVRNPASSSCGSFKSDSDYRKISGLSLGFSQEIHATLETIDMVKANRRQFLQGCNNVRTMDTAKLEVLSDMVPEIIAPGIVSVEPGEWITSDGAAQVDCRETSSNTVSCDIRIANENSEEEGKKISTKDIETMNGNTVFDSYNLTYPSYGQRLKNFIRACVYLDWLLSAKVAPHPCLWDDFIRVFSSDYLQYVKKCKTLEQQPTSCIQFYNVNIQDPIFTKRILSPSTLSDALLLDYDITSKLRDIFQQKSAARSIDHQSGHRRRKDLEPPSGDKRNYRSRQPSRIALPQHQHSHKVDVHEEGAAVPVCDNPEVALDDDNSIPTSFGSTTRKRLFFETSSQIGSEKRQRRASLGSLSKNSKQPTAVNTGPHPHRPMSPILGEYEGYSEPTQVPNSTAGGDCHSEGRASLDLEMVKKMAKDYIPRRKRISEASLQNKFKSD